MTLLRTFDFENAGFEIRADIPAAFRRAWTHIATPGSGWDSGQRIAIAEQCRAARDCQLCDERKTALNPLGTGELHAAQAPLPSAAIEAIHRIMTDPARLSQSWLDGLLKDGLTDTQYVEIIGVVSTVVSIDTFCLALKLPLESLPQSVSGEATGYRPERLRAGGSWLPLLMENDLAPAEKNVYEGLKQGANVLRALSLVPNEVRNLNQLSESMYLNNRLVSDINADGGRSLTRDQTELLAARVSVLNECFY